MTDQSSAVDASHLTPTERSALGITTRLPKSLAGSTGSLDQDERLQSILGKELVQCYLSVKRAESARLQAMAEEERRLWLLARY